MRNFLDTNVLLYTLDTSDPVKQQRALTLVRDGVQNSSIVISFQVLNECLNVALRKALVKLSPEAAQLWADSVLIPLVAVQSSASLTRKAIDIHDRYRIGFYDAMIVAAALQANCERLFSEDLQHGMKFERLQVHNPFF
jgi:predicted nucleic acid-binding protein